VTVLYDNHQFEVTTFRLDGPSKDFRHPESVIYSDQVIDDVQRRDFTMNGLLMDEKYQVIDHVGGKTDIENKLIRAIGDPDQRFQEDALRMLRALYFQSKLGFEVEAATKASMTKHRSLIKNISMERIHQELIKTLKGKHLKKALQTLIECKFDDFLPGLKKGIHFVSKLEKMPFVDTFFTLAFVLNEGIIPREWPFSNKHRHKYQKAAELALKTDAHLSDLDLYHYGLEISILANKANFYLGKAKHLERKITAQFKNLPVHAEIDLALTSEEMIQFMNKKPGAWLSQLKKELIENILLKKLTNDKAALYHYLESKQD